MIGGQVQIVQALSKGPQRFSQLRDTIGDTSSKALTESLRALQRDGYITRTVIPDAPPGVEYALTDLGHKLQTPIDSVRTWAHAQCHVA